MSSNPQFILEAIPPGAGFILDLGGSKGMLRRPLMERGYNYINLDIRDFGDGEPSLVGDAHRLPFKDSTLDAVVSKDTLQHFLEPWVVIGEIYRVLKIGGQFIIWVPFMHPFHGDDFYRYSPEGLKHLLKNFDIVTFESPLWLFTVAGLAVIEALKRVHLNSSERWIKPLCGLLDRIFTRHHSHPASFAAAYRLIVRKPGITKICAETTAVDLK